MTTSIRPKCELNFENRHWMIDLAAASRRAEKVVVKNFRPTSASVRFIKALSNENHLFISSCDNDLVLERLASDQLV